MIVFPGVDDGRGCRNMYKMLRGSNLDERQSGVGGGCLVGETTGYLREGPFRWRCGCVTGRVAMGIRAGGVDEGADGVTIFYTAKFELWDLLVIMGLSGRYYSDSNLSQVWSRFVLQIFFP